MCKITNHERFELDVHGYTIREVDVMLNKLIWDLGSNYKEVEIIHGYNFGSTIREHIRNEYCNSRIERIVYFENPGRTSIFLRMKEN